MAERTQLLALLTAGSEEFLAARFARQKADNAEDILGLGLTLNAMQYLLRAITIIVLFGAHQANTMAKCQEAVNMNPEIVFLRSIPAAESAQGDQVSFEGPFGVQATDERLYVADDLGHVVYVFDQDLKLIQMIGHKGSGPGELAYVDCALEGPNSRLYIADTGNNRVQVFNRDGTYLKEVKNWGLFNRFSNPRDLSFDNKGRMFVTDWGNHCVQVFDARLRHAMTIGKKGQGPAEFFNPIVLTHSPDDRLFVSDFKNHRIQVFDPDGGFLFMFGERGDGPGQFEHPVGLDFDDRQRLYVADPNNGRIEVFYKYGEWISTFDPKPEEHGCEIIKPADLSIGPDNRLYVVDKERHAVLVYKIY